VLVWRCCALWLVLALGPWLAAPAARANAWDVYGFGPRALGMGGAFTSLADDFTACYYNPAALTVRPKVHVGVGLLAGIPVLSIERTRMDPAYPSKDTDLHTGVTLGAIFPLGAKIDNRVAFGISTYIPTRNLFRLDAVDPQWPHFYLYRSLPEKLVLAPALAFRILNQLSVGIGLQVLADLNGMGDFSADLVNRRLTRRSLRVDISPNAALTAGILAGPFAGFRLGVSYRGSLALNYRIPSLFGLEGLGQLALDVHGVTAWTPNHINLGISYEFPGKNLRLAFDLNFSQWSGAPDPSAKVELNTQGEVIDRLGLGQTLDLSSPELGLGASNTWTPRIGIEWTPSAAWAVRGGYFYRPTPLPRQTGYTNYLDNDAHGFSVGVAWTTPDLLEIHRNPVTFEFSMLTLYLPNRAVQKRSAVDPVGDLQSSGAIFTLAVSMRHDF
jgi:long-chain fatty acid transport protein